MRLGYRRSQKKFSVIDSKLMFGERFLCSTLFTRETLPKAQRTRGLISANQSHIANSHTNTVCHKKSSLTFVCLSRKMSIFSRCIKAGHLGPPVNMSQKIITCSRCVKGSFENCSELFQELLTRIQ